MLSTMDQVFKIPDTIPNNVVVSGEGQKKLVIITDLESFSDSESDTLDKMMTAIKYNPSHDLIKVVLPKNVDVSLSSLVNDYKDLIIFGVLPERIGLFIEYKMNEILYFEKSRLLICESIRAIIAVPQKKQLLWTRLQEMFLK